MCLRILTGVTRGEDVVGAVHPLACCVGVPGTTGKGSSLSKAPSSMRGSQVSSPLGMSCWSCGQLTSSFVSMSRRRSGSCSLSGEPGSTGSAGVWHSMSTTLSESPVNS